MSRSREDGIVHDRGGFMADIKTYTDALALVRKKHLQMALDHINALLNYEPLTDDDGNFMDPESEDYQETAYALNLITDMLAEIVKSHKDLEDV